MLTVPELIEQISGNIRRIDAITAYRECRQLDGLVIDVREADEVADKPVDGSLNIPRGLLEMKISALGLEADTPIFIHCATGVRATLAAEQLQRLGYSRVTAISCALDEIFHARNKGALS
ncbi:MAG: rhodanese-like domain-containing protein [Alphaproteobacteria bacterium]|nr:rhodanese-like domain-containing protein [Alphaproteobacteria bacterium]